MRGKLRLLMSGIHGVLRREATITAWALRLCHTRRDGIWNRRSAQLGVLVRLSCTPRLHDKIDTLRVAYFHRKISYDVDCKDDNDAFVLHRVANNLNKTDERIDSDTVVRDVRVELGCNHSLLEMNSIADRQAKACRVCRGGST